MTKPVLSADRLVDASPPATGANDAPVSFVQQARFDLNDGLQKAGKPVPSSIWCMVDPYRIRGSLDLDVLESSFRTLLRRHPALAYRFAETDSGWWQVPGDPEGLSLDVRDLTNAAAAERESIAQQAVAELTALPFDPRRSPQLRVLVLRLDRQEHVLVTAVDHMVYDVLSGVVMYEDLTAIYRGLMAGATELGLERGLPYGDFAAWQRAHFTGDTLTAALEGIRSRLGGGDPIVAYRFPFARRRPSEELRWHVGYADIDFPPEAREAVEDLSRRLRMSRFAVHVSGLLVLLGLVTDREDVRLRTPVANRIRPGTQRAVGWFANAVVVGATLADNDRFEDVVRRVWTDFLATLEGQELPFDLVLRHLQPEAYPQWNDIPTVALTYHDRVLDVRPEFGSDNVSFDEDMLAGVEDYPVTMALINLRLEDMHGALRLSARYRSDLYTDPGVLELLVRFRDVMQRVARDPSISIADLRIEAAGWFRP